MLTKTLAQKYIILEAKLFGLEKRLKEKENNTNG